MQLLNNILQGAFRETPKKRLGFFLSFLIIIDLAVFRRTVLLKFMGQRKNSAAPYHHRKIYISQKFGKLATLNAGWANCPTLPYHWSSGVIFHLV